MIEVNEDTSSVPAVANAAARVILGGNHLRIVRGISNPTGNR